ncbi:unnamed protein product [Oikopleura dioica]|uniref:Uncharacterized protein n=1 Tax=Oikopleura dioica TaxID=34765 RepID=E4YNS2_OIKDI|nr:unnamed protein product [Oikopleura dioica]
MKKLTVFLLVSQAFCQEKSFKKDLILALTEEHEGPHEVQRLRRATSIEKFNAAAVAFTSSISIALNAAVMLEIVSLMSSNSFCSSFCLSS